MLSPSTFVQNTTRIADPRPCLIFFVTTLRENEANCKTDFGTDGRFALPDRMWVSIAIVLFDLRTFDILIVDNWCTENEKDGPCGCGGGVICFLLLHQRLHFYPRRQIIKPTDRWTGGRLALISDWMRVFRRSIFWYVIARLEASRQKDSDVLSNSSPCTKRISCLAWRGVVICFLFIKVVTFFLSVSD